MNPPFLQVFCAIFSGAMQAFAISNEILPWGSPFIALFSLSPLYIALYKSKTYFSSFWLFFIQILTVHLLSSYWLANFHGFATFTLGASALGTAFEGGLCGVIMHVFPHRITEEKKLKEKAGANPSLIFKRILWFSSCWVMYEYIKSNGAMGYPWGTLSMASYKWKVLNQISDITGVWGITFLYALFSAVFAEGICFIKIKNRNEQVEKITTPEEKTNTKNYFEVVKFTAVLFLISTIYGTFQFFIPREKEKEFNAVIVQQNVDPWEVGDKESIKISKRLTEKGIKELLEEGKECDLVVWSEGILSRSFPNGENYYSSFPKDESLVDFIKRTETPFLIGGETAVDKKKHKYANSALLFDKDGVYAGSYSKMQLVPFAEKIPYAGNPLMDFFMQEVVGFYTNLVPGFQRVLFKIPIKKNKNLEAPMDYDRPLEERVSLDENGRSDPKEKEKFLKNPKGNPLSFVSFTSPICFEDAFPSICSSLFKMGSEVFINITNDSWSKTKSAELQHFIAASYRAIEYRTTLVRTANSGYSVLVDPSGRILKDIPLFKEDEMAISIPVYPRKKTVYLVFGDWFSKSLIFLIFSYIVFVFVSENKEKKIFSRLKNENNN